MIKKFCVIFMALILGGSSMPVMPGVTLNDVVQKAFVPVISSNYIDGTIVDNFEFSFPHGFLLPANLSTKAHGAFVVPADFVGDMSITPHFIVSGAGNIYIEGVAYHRADGEDENEHSDSFDPAAVAATGAYIALEAGTILLTNVTVGDVVVVELNRYGDNVADTHSGNVWITGWVVTYTSNR